MYFPVTYNREVIPPEIVLNILLHASPLDLLRVQITSRYFRDILEANQHLWRLARKSLNPPVPDPVLPKEMYGREANWSESAYANHVFGRSNCSFCGDSVDHLWVRSYYSLRQIVCIKGECRSAKHRDRIPLPKLKAGAPWYIRALQFYLPYEPDATGTHPRYSRMQIARAKEEGKVASERFKRGQTLDDACKEIPELREFRRRLCMRQDWLYAIMKTGDVLTIWHNEWVAQTARLRLDQKNMERVRGYLVGENIKFSNIRSSMTFSRWYFVFLKSQTVIDRSAWFHIKKHVLREALEANAGIVRLPLSKGWKGKLQCPFCQKVEHPRIFGTSVALEDHVRVKHPQNTKMVIRA